MQTCIFISNTASVQSLNGFFKKNPETDEKIIIKKKRLWRIPITQTLTREMVSLVMFKDSFSGNLEWKGLEVGILQVQR